ncbi:hypothetical protein T10_1092 [Trichinella papuae]|uniref:Uncharacterized protein n=1 Tax=Trichinella papuae TaxID=268474 RepID=A0A0V1MAD7_9BILA|nr:hypothetical protein T10_1092 [Trichinella papuae]
MKLYNGYTFSDSKICVKLAAHCSAHCLFGRLAEIEIFISTIETIDTEAISFRYLGKIFILQHIVDRLLSFIKSPINDALIILHINADLHGAASKNSYFHFGSTKSFDGLNSTAGRSNNSPEDVEVVIARRDRYLKVLHQNHSGRHWWLWIRFQQLQSKKFIDVVFPRYPSHVTMAIGFQLIHDEFD